jgi:hypothetical protein
VPAHLPVIVCPDAAVSGGARAGLDGLALVATCPAAATGSDMRSGMGRGGLPVP